MTLVQRSPATDACVEAGHPGSVRDRGGMMRAGRTGTPLIAFVVVASLIVGAGVPTAARERVTTTQPNQVLVLPGDSFEIRAGGFSPGEAVDVFLDRTEVALAVADQGGAVVTAVTAPSSWGEGSHWVTLEARRTDRIVQQEVRVAAPTPSAWAQGKADAARSGFTTGELLLTPGNVRDLQFAWGDEPYTEDSTIGGPVSYGGVTYVIGSTWSPDAMQTLDALGRDGAVRWSSPIVGTAHDQRLGYWWGTPLAAGNGQIAVHLFDREDPSTHVIAVFDARTGAPGWRVALPCPTCGGAVERVIRQGWGELTGWGSMTLAGDTLIVPVNVWSPSSWPGGFGQVCAVRITDGTVRWCREVDAPSDVAVSGESAVVFSLAHARIFALDTETGAERWRVDLAPEGLWGGMNAGPTIVGDLVLASSGEGLRALRLRDGLEVWRSPIEGSQDVVTDGEAVFVTDATVADPWWCEGTIDCHPEDARLWALDARTGEERWRRSFGQEWFWRMAGAGGTLFVQAGGSVYAVRTSDGRVLTVFPSETWFEGGLIVADGGVTSSGGGGVVRFDTDAGLTAPDPAELPPDPSLTPGETHEMSHAVTGWDRAETRGLGGANTDVSGLATFHGGLYLGTTSRSNAGEIWRTLDGETYERIHRFEDAASVELAVFQDTLYATANAAGGFTLWRSEEGQRFTNVDTVQRAPTSVRSTPIAFAGRLLLAIDDESAGARLLASDDGERFAEIATGGLGRPEVRRFARDASRPELHGVVMGDALYLGLAGGRTGGDLWRVSDDLRVQRVPVPTGIAGVIPQVAHEGAVYSLINGSDGLRVARSTDAGTEEVFTTEPSAGVDGSLVVLDEVLLLATRTPDQRRASDEGPIEVGLTSTLRLLRSTDGLAWERVAEGIFTDPHDFAGTLLSEGGVAYLMAENYREGDGIWRSDDGLTWELMFREEPSPTTTGAALTVFGGHLLAFHGDPDGLQVWRYGTPVPVGEPTSGPFWGWLSLVVVGALLVLSGVIARRRSHHPRWSPRNAPAPT